MQHHNVRIDPSGFNLQAHDSGGPGEAVLFLHFSGANLMMWSRVVSEFEQKYRVVLLDLRGHGTSDRSPDGYAIDDMARDVVVVIEQLNLGRVHVVGSSLGAEVGLSLAANAPERVSSLVCEGAPCSEYGPYSTWEGSEETFEAHVAEQLGKMRSTPETVFSSIDALVEAKRGVLQTYGWWNEDVEAMVRYGVRQTEGGGVTESFGRPALAEYMEQYFRKRFEEDYRRVTCPLLLTFGKDDLEDPGEKAVIEALCGLAKHGRIVEVDRWLHPYGWLLDPEPMCDAILPFLTS